jgi:3-oxoacyl-[acyl-carrier protein] reductase
LLDRVALVTGASRGIGKATALALGRAGATVVLGARQTEDLQQAAELLAAEGITAHALPLDVAQSESVSAFAASAVELCGPPSILVNNAGCALYRDFLETSVADFDRQVDVNFKGAWYMARAAAPHMRHLGDAHIVQISALASTLPPKRTSAYAAAKRAAEVMMEVLAVELSEFGIRTTTIALGPVHTRFHRDAMPASNQRDDSWMLSPEQVAAAVLQSVLAPASVHIPRLELRPVNLR